MTVKEVEYVMKIWPSIPRLRSPFQLLKDLINSPPLRPGKGGRCRNA